MVRKISQQVAFITLTIFYVYDNIPLNIEDYLYVKKYKIMQQTLSIFSEEPVKLLMKE